MSDKGLADPTLRQLCLLRRQYFQLIPVSQLQWPATNVLKKPSSQAWMFNKLLSEDDAGLQLPSEGYRLRFLKQLVHDLESAYDDVENDEISDELLDAMSNLMHKTRASEFELAQRKQHVTYSFPTQEDQASDRTVTLLESPALLAAGATTGLRTWEAALHLGAYLASDQGIHHVRLKRVVEIGAGTGLVAALCAKYLSATHVLATDGSAQVIHVLSDNMFLNGIEDIVKCRRYIWGTLLDNDKNDDGEVVDTESVMAYDTVLGADVLYDSSLFPLLLASFQSFLDENANTEIVLSTTIRNQATYAQFEQSCRMQSH